MFNISTTNALVADFMLLTAVDIYLHPASMTTTALIITIVIIIIIIIIRKR